MISHQMVKTIRDGNAVTRWHTRKMLTRDSVGEHTANVLSIVFALCPDRRPSMALIGATLLHDIAEQWTGDIPATAKWDSPELKEAADNLEKRKLGENWLEQPQLTDEEALILKWADMLELCYRCLDEINLGNRNAYEIFDRGVDYLRNLPELQSGLSLLTELRKDRTYV
jgi:5'-deoxynucleotidase YfbR-like HD superfamily hydrolase